MNVFILSPGRTATKTLTYIFSKVPGYTSGHETRCKYLGGERVDYPENHIECDNRLSWFMPRLTKKYSKEAVLVVVHRDHESVAKSYNHRWQKINIMKAYSQGVLKREFSENDLDVCRDYVSNVYEQIESFSGEWRHVVHLDLDDPELGVSEVLRLIGCPEKTESTLHDFSITNLNPNKVSNFKRQRDVFRYNLKCIMHDMKW